MRPRVAAAGLALALALALPCAASAQAREDAAATRRALIDDALRAADGGDHARALDLAQRAGRIEMTPSLRRFIAEEHRAAGHLAASLGAAELCVRDARASTLAGSAAHLAACEAIAADVGPRVGRVVVRVPEPAPQGARVEVAGADLPDALWGVAHIVDPGRVVVTASAPGRAPFRAEVDVAAGATREVDVALAPVAPSPSVPGQGGERGEPARARSRVPQLVVAGAGLAAVGAGAVLVAMREGALGEAARACGVPSYEQCGGAPTQDAHAAGEAHYRRAATFDAVSTVALVAGGVALAAGTAWYLLAGAPSREARRAGASVSIAPLQGGAWIGLGGAL